MPLKKFIIKLLVITFILVLYCEFLIYYVVLSKCAWPNLEQIEIQTSEKNAYKPINVMLLADTHLLGSRKGHWLDKLRREWEMTRAFQASMYLHKPDVVFVLGDLFDEGLYCSHTEFQQYVKRFRKLFKVPDGTKMFVVAGNHDIGFHYGISPYLLKRFNDAFGTSGAQLITIEGNQFVLVNSMALEGDGCFLCQPTEMQLLNIEKRLKCAKNGEFCDKVKPLKYYSRPILLQHYPLYRESDLLNCVNSTIITEQDLAPEIERGVRLRENWECLSRGATYALLRGLKPRLAIGGHTHHGCHRNHTTSNGLNTEEFSIPSFSWRNRANPSFLMARISPEMHAINICRLPKELTIIFIYLFGVVAYLFITICYKHICDYIKFKLIFYWKSSEKLP